MNEDPMSEVPGGVGGGRVLDVIAAERSQLLNVAYRLLGSLSEAEDVVQEACARWYAQTPEQQRDIASPGAWLNTVVGRLCLDVLRSARSRREHYVGEWLPEPVPDALEWPHGSGSGAADPADRITLDETVDMAFLMVLEVMTPAERVTFLLHDVFGYPFPEVAEIVGRSSAACRQLASSARRRVRQIEPVQVPSRQRARLVGGFKQAWESKDVGALVALLDPDATVIADGGGIVSASLDPVVGSDEIARYLVGLAERADLASPMNLLERTVNGKAGLVAMHDDVIVGVFAFDVERDQIQRIWVVRNPEKLRPWNER